MLRSRRWYALVCACAPLLLLTPLRGDDPPPKEKQPSKEVDPVKANVIDKKLENTWLVDQALTISPAPAPVPSLKYRLYPSVTERKAGNAVPIYLRLSHERSDATKKELVEKADEWRKVPLDKLPLAEVKAFLEKQRYNFKQLELGARRKSAEWEYTLDAGDPINLLLPDLHDMRVQALLLALKARFEIAEGNYAEAIRTLETGFSFSQQILEGPFLISGLVGIACAEITTASLYELLEHPETPNLYWALAVLPRPLMSLRQAYEFELQFFQLQFPELTALDRPRSAAQWDSLLKQYRTNFEKVLRFEKEAKKLAPGTTAADPAAKSPDLDAARKYLKESVKIPAAQVDAMPPAQLLLLHIWHYTNEIRDDIFKGTYLSYTEDTETFKMEKDRLTTLPDIEAARLSRMLMPAIRKVRTAEIRIDRKLTALRVLEALRMHAAKTGSLPDKLSDVTVVAVPNDPGTGKPFEYQRDGQTATLVSRVAGEPLNITGLRYRVTLRK